jgi:RNA polymerase sigma-70 factor (ECF subfamily)
MTDWDQIVSRCGPAVWRIAYRLLGSTPDAEDCFQETFVAALRLTRAGPVRHWCALLQRLATAQAIDRLRRRTRRRAREAPADCDTHSGPGPPPDEQAAAGELSQRLRQALPHLPARAAEVFCLHALEGWSYAEVAGQLGISVDAVGVALHRARRRLQALLGPALTGRGKEEGR